MPDPISDVLADIIEQYAEDRAKERSILDDIIKNTNGKSRKGRAIIDEAIENFYKDQSRLKMNQRLGKALLKGGAKLSLLSYIDLIRYLEDLIVRKTAMLAAQDYKFIKDQLATKCIYRNMRECFGKGSLSHDKKPSAFDFVAKGCNEHKAITEQIGVNGPIGNASVAYAKAWCNATSEMIEKIEEVVLKNTRYKKRDAPDEREYYEGWKTKCVRRGHPDSWPL